MTSIQENFHTTAERVKHWKKPPEDVFFELYGLYKQATEFDCKEEKPNEVESEKKWKAWHNFKGLSKEEAMKKYIARANEMSHLYEKIPETRK